MSRLAVSYSHPDVKSQAQALADKLHVVVDNNADSSLYLTPEKLYLKHHKLSPMSADFSFSTWKKRKLEGKKQALVRAVKPEAGLKIIDATSGWGRDAAILASFGAQVLMMERNPIMAALLQDALDRRTEEDKKLMDLILLEQDAISYLNSLSITDYPQIIYIDPMHPERQKSALVKKDMQVLQQIIGTDLDALELISAAVNHVQNRVVVKWPQKQNSLIPANASIEGKTVRYDLYFARCKE